MTNENLYLCRCCELNHVPAGVDYCPNCQTALDNGESWALAMVELKNKVRNAARREVPIESFKAMESTVETLEHALGMELSPGFLDLMEKYDPAIRHIQEILDTTASATARESMVIQFYEIVINYLAHTPEEFDKRGDGGDFFKFHLKAFNEKKGQLEPEFVYATWVRSCMTQNKPVMDWRTFKRRLRDAKRTLKEYEKIN